MLNSQNTRNLIELNPQILAFIGDIMTLHGIFKPLNSSKNLFKCMSQTIDDNKLA